jgi:hypothetical protein
MTNNEEGKKKEIILDKSGVSVTASGIGEYDRAFYFPETVSTEDIVVASTATAGIELVADEKSKLTHTIEVVKTYFSEIELSVTFEKGITFRVRKEPKKIIQTLE